MKVFATSLFITLLAAARTHPVTVGITGAATGILTWTIQWAEHLTILFRVISGFFGCALALISFLFLVPRTLRFFINWRKRGIRHADLDSP